MSRDLASISLPVDDVIGDVRNCLATAGIGVLVAPPGAGKTTRVPLALMHETWVSGRKILVLEPRRIAARAAAERMAATLGERVGDSVGLRARLATRVGPRTSVEVVTEGVFTRMLIDDPELTGVAAVLFDEFHERSLDADLGLALALDCRAALRPDLRVLVMSATLDVGRVAALLGGAPIIRSEGRMFAVETRYDKRKSQRVEDDVAQVITRTLNAEPGSILVFLPGQGEIRRVVERLNEARTLTSDVDVLPLYGALSGAEQDNAIAPPRSGRRKVVLATAIAETSITIDGVRIVIDSGLARVPRYDADAGVTALATVRVSRASADQRRGRAGRTAPGICIRLWDEPETQGLMAFDTPEILQADLSGLLLDCAEWGAVDPRKLMWLDAPPEGRIAAARSELQAIGALDDAGRMTPEGRALRAVPLPARLAKMLVKAAELGAERLAAEIAAIIVERGIGGMGVDLAARLANFRHDTSRRATDLRRLAAQWATSVCRAPPVSETTEVSAAALLAIAFPDRIAKARGARGQFLLANGRAGFVDSVDPLAAADFIVVADMQGRAAATRIVLAVETTVTDVMQFAADRIETVDEHVFDETAGAVRARRTTRMDAVTLAAEQRPVVASAETADMLAKHAIRRGVDFLPWSKSQLQLRQRAEFVRRAGITLPDLSDEALAQNDGQWLSPYLVGKTRLSDIRAEDLNSALDSLLTWDDRRRLDADAPTHFDAPTGNRFALDYESDGAPVLRIRVQELFGQNRHPTIAEGRIPLTLHLLSPAARPIQITRDLPGFWSGSWASVRADMRGQYPKHPWPEDPANELPTARAKPRR